MVGVLRGHEISFAYHGQPEVTLFYKNQELDELADMDVLAEQNNVRGDTLFSSVLQGTINYGDYFYIATPRVADFFNSDRVKKILQSRNTRQAAGHIQKVLSDLRQESSFGGILIHFTTKYDLPKTGRMPKNANGSTGSLNKLVDQEQTTKEMLATPLWGGLKKHWNKFRANRSADKKKKTAAKAKQTADLSRQIRQLAETAGRTERGKMETNWRPQETQISVINSVLVTIGKIIVIGFTGLFRLLKNILFSIAKITIALILIISNKDNKRADVLKTSRRWRETKKEAFLGLPLLSKILLILTIVLAIVFIASVGIFKIKENIQARRHAYQNQIQAILDKKNAAEASLVYGDETRALNLLQEAKETISSLPTNSKKQKEEANGLSEQVNASLMKIQKLYTITPELLLDIANINPTAQTQRLARLDDNLFAYGEEDNSYYQYDLIGNGAENKNYGNNLHLHAASTPKEQDIIVFAAGDNGAAIYNKETSLLMQKDIVFPVNDVKLSDLFIYNRKVYTLDPANNQIFKHSQTQTGFDKGVAWLKEGGIDLKDAVSMAIDGDMFVLKQNGEIVKLTAGRKADFTISGLEPKLDKPLAIWTYNNLANIYILEPTNKRIVILDKTGKLIGQYTAVEWQNPGGMIVDEVKKTVYVLDNNKIYRFNF